MMMAVDVSLKVWDPTAREFPKFLAGVSGYAATEKEIETIAEVIRAIQERGLSENYLVEPLTPAPGSARSY